MTSERETLEPDRLDDGRLDNGLVSPTIPPEWLSEFEAAAKRPLKMRFRYAFIKTYKPVMDDEPFRAFDTTADYRKWCNENVPSWLGYDQE